MSFVIATDATNPSSYLVSIPVIDSGEYEQTITVEINENDSQFKNAVQTMISTAPSSDTGVGLLFNNYHTLFSCSYRFSNESQEQRGGLDSITSEYFQVLGVNLYRRNNRGISAEEFFNRLSSVGEVIINVYLAQP